MQAAETPFSGFKFCMQLNGGHERTCSRTCCPRLPSLLLPYLFIRSAVMKSSTLIGPWRPTTAFLFQSRSLPSLAPGVIFVMPIFAGAEWTGMKPYGVADCSLFRDAKKLSVFSCVRTLEGMGPPFLHEDKIQPKVLQM